MVFWNCIVCLHELCYDFVCELVNRLMLLACIVPGQFFDLIISIKLNPVPKHFYSCICIKTPVSLLAIFCFLQNWHVSRAWCFAKQIILALNPITICKVGLGWPNRLLFLFWRGVRCVLYFVAWLGIIHGTPFIIVKEIVEVERMHIHFLSHGIVKSGDLISVE